MEILADVSQWAGALALAAFAGTLLGGIALSFFWKNFGPWKLLEACRQECEECHNQRREDQKVLARLQAKYADLYARYELVMAALERGGLGLQLSQLPMTRNLHTPPAHIIDPEGDSDAN